MSSLVLRSFIFYLLVLEIVILGSCQNVGEFQGTASNVTRSLATSTSLNKTGGVPESRKIKTSETQSNVIEDNDSLSLLTNKSQTSRKYKDYFNLGREIRITDNRIPESWAEEVGTWEPPYEIAKAYPYYVSGFDAKNRPIWISEWGKFDMRLLFKGDIKKNTEAFERYTKQAAYLAVLSHEIRSTPENPVKQHAFIIDFDGLTLAQLGNRQIVSYCLDLGRRFRGFFEKNIGKMILINVNGVAEILINLARHIFGRILGRVESYGTDKSQWEAALLRNFPKDQLPEWYGGTKNHTPIYVFG